MGHISPVLVITVTFSTFRDGNPYHGSGDGIIYTDASGEFTSPGYSETGNGFCLSHCRYFDC